MTKAPQPDRNVGPGGFLCQLSESQSQLAAAVTEG